MVSFTLLGTPSGRSGPALDASNTAAASLPAIASPLEPDTFGADLTCASAPGDGSSGNDIDLLSGQFR